jgi:biopolymer transport protein ExbD
MASTETAPLPEGKGKARKNKNPSIDMTPMVDLGFLLITFFIFTTTLSEKNAMALVMPAQGPPTAIADKNALTLLLGKNSQIYAYQGQWEKAVREGTIVTMGYLESNGLGQMIRERQRQLGKGREDLVLVIKPLPNSSYKNVIDALDEVAIHDVKKYALVDPDEEERRRFE